MDNDERRQYDDSLFEEVSVVTAGTVAGTALLFNQEGGGRKINNFFLKQAIRAKAYSRYLSDNIDDLTQINFESFKNVGREADKSFEALRNGSLAFRATDTMAVKQLFDAYSNTFNANTFLRNAYDSDLRKVAMNAINSVDNLPENIRSAFISNVGIFASSSDTPKDIHARIAKRLSAANFNLASEPMNAIIEVIEAWKAENPFDDGENSWVRKKGNTAVKEYAEKMFDWKSALQRQEESKQETFSKIYKKINPDKNVTIGDILDIRSGEDSENRRLINRLLNRDKVIQLGIDDIDKLLPDDSTKAAMLRRKQAAKVADKNISLSAVELMEAQASKLKDNADQLEAFKKLEISGLHFGNDGKIYTTADTFEALDKVAGELFDTFPFRMLKVNDIRAEKLARKPTYFFKSGTMDPVIADAQGVKDFVNDTVVSVNGLYYQIDDSGHLTQIHSLDNAITRSVKTGYMKKAAQAQNKAIAAMSDEQKNFLERKLNFEFEGIVKLTKENGHNADVFAAFTQAAVDNMNAIKVAAMLGDNIDYYNFADTRGTSGNGGV